MKRFFITALVFLAPSLVLADGFWNPGVDCLPGTAGTGDVVVDAGSSLCVQKPSTDTAPSDLSIRPASAWPFGTQDAADLILAGGMDEKFITVDDQSLASGDFVTVTVNGVALAPLVEGVDFDCLIDVNTCAIALAVAIEALSGASSAAIAAKVGIEPDQCGTWSLSTTIADGGVDGAFATSSNGVDGQVLAPGYPSGSVSAPTYSFTGDQDTGIWSNSPNRIAFGAGGVIKANITTGALQLRSVPLTDPSAAVDIGGACTPVTTPDVTGNACFPGAINVQGVLSVKDGSAGSPGVGFANDANTGMYRTGTDAVGFSTGGIRRVNIDGSSFQLSQMPTTDADPADPLICAANAWPQATGANQTGGTLYLAGGIGSRAIVIDDWNNCGTDTVTLTVDGSATVLTEASEWTAATSNDATAISLCAAVDTAAIGLTGDAVTLAGTCYITQDADLRSMDLAEGDPACTTLVEGDDGPVSVGTTRVVFGTDGGEYIEWNPANSMQFYTNSALSMQIQAAQVDFRLPVKNGAAALDIGSSCAPTTMADASGNMVACGEASFEGDAYFEAAANFRSVVNLGDNIKVRYGAVADYWHKYDSAGTEFRFVSTDADGIGTDGTVWSVQDGTDDVDFNGRFTFEPLDVDFVIPFSAASLGPAAPTVETKDGMRVLCFDADNEEAYPQFEVPDCWDASSDLGLKIYWVAEDGDAIAAGETVEWEAHYNSIDWGTEDTDVRAQTIADVTYTQPGGGDSDKKTYEHTITIDYDHGSEPISTGDVLQFEFHRDVSTDTYSGDACVHHWEVMVTTNRICDHY